jgi:hypothetical protein
MAPEFAKRIEAALAVARQEIEDAREAINRSAALIEGATQGHVRAQALGAIANLETTALARVEALAEGVRNEAGFQRWLKSCWLVRDGVGDIARYATDASAATVWRETATQTLADMAEATIAAVRKAERSWWVLVGAVALALVLAAVVFAWMRGAR